MTRRLELGRVLQILRGFILLAVRSEHHSQIEIGLKNFGIDLERLAIGGDCLIMLVQSLFSVAEVVPGLVALGILLCSLLQQRFRTGSIAFA